MSNKDEIKIQFEWMVIFKHVGCDIAYGKLYINDMSAPALRLCVDTHIADLSLKVDGNSLSIISKAPYYIQIPPYRYVVYMTSPDVLYLISTWEARRVFCNAPVSICSKLPPTVYGPMCVEYVYTILKNALADGRA